MSAQLSLVVEDIHEALAEIVRALGGNEAVGVRLYPERTPAAAATFVRNATSPTRAERFNPEQVWLLFVWARQAGFHNAKRWFDESTGYVPGEPLEPDDERAKLQRDFIESVNRQADLVARMERIGVVPAASAKGRR